MGFFEHGGAWKLGAIGALFLALMLFRMLSPGTTQVSRPRRRRRPPPGAS